MVNEDIWFMSGHQVHREAAITEESLPEAWMHTASASSPRPQFKLSCPLFAT